MKFSFKLQLCSNRSQYAHISEQVKIIRGSGLASSIEIQEDKAFFSPPSYFEDDSCPLDSFLG